MPFDVRLRAYEPDGPALGLLPYPTHLSVSFVHNDDGALSLTYSSLVAGGRHLARGLEQGLEVAVEVTTPDGKWTEPRNGRYLLIARDSDQADETGTLRLTLPSYSWLRRKARNLNTEHLLPESHSMRGRRPFYSANAGVIVGTLLAENAERGGIPLAFGATSVADSAGEAWATVATLYYDLGLGLDAVVDNLAAQGMCDWRTRGRTLELWNADTACAPDLAGTVRLWLGKDVTEAPSSESLAELVSRVLIRAEDGLYMTEDNPTAPTPWGAWEGFISQGGVADEGTARQLVQAELERTGRVRGQYTRALILHGEPEHWPLVDYTPGAWITAPTTGSGERVRVQQITLTRDDNGVTGSVVLNDRFVDAELRRAKRVAGIVGGATADGGSGVRPAPDVPESDTRAPAAPVGLVVDSDAYIDADGAARGVLSALWDEVTTATDGTLLEVAGYDVDVREAVAGAQWLQRVQVESTTAQVSPVEVGAVLQVRVRARGRYTPTPGEWSDYVTVTVAADTTPPPAPAGVTASQHLGVVSVEWGGGAASGGTMPRDFARVEVWQEGVASGPVGTIDSPVGGRVLIGGLPYDVAARFQARAVDRSGNPSPFSPWVSATPRRAGADDIGARSVTANALDVGSARAAILEAGVVTGEVLSGDALNGKTITGALIRTSASGDRTEVDATGAHVYGSNGEVVVDLSAEVETGLAVRNPYTGEMTPLARTMFPNEVRAAHVEQSWNGWSSTGFVNVSLSDVRENIDRTDKLWNGGALWKMGPELLYSLRTNPVVTTVQTGQAITPLESNPSVAASVEYAETGSGVRTADAYLSLTGAADPWARTETRQYLRAYPVFTPRSGGTAVTGPAVDLTLSDGVVSTVERSAGSGSTRVIGLQAGVTYDISWRVLPVLSLPMELRRQGTQYSWGGQEFPYVNKLFGDHTFGAEERVPGEFYPRWSKFWALCTKSGAPNNIFPPPQAGDDESTTYTYHSSLPTRRPVLLHSLSTTFYYATAGRDVGAGQDGSLTLEGPLRVHADGPTSSGYASDTHPFQVGADNVPNLIMNSSTVQSRGGPLRLNPHGNAVVVGRTLNGSSRELELSDSGWIACTLGDGWTSYSTSFSGPPMVRRVGALVYLRGFVKKSTAATYQEVIATVPAGFRPAVRQVFSIVRSNNAFGTVDVNTSGQILSRVANETWTSLDGISWFID